MKTIACSIGFAAVLFSAAQPSAAGTFSFVGHPVRSVTARQRTSTSHYANDSLWQVPASDFANFNGLVTLNNLDAFTIVGSARQYSVMSPTQIVARGGSSLLMNARVGLEDYARTESNLDLYFHLNEPHNATLYVYTEETDVAGGAIGSCGVSLDADGWVGSEPGSVFLQQVYPLAAGDHELAANVYADGIVNDTDPAELHHQARAEFYIVINLDGGTADVPVTTGAARLTSLANPVRGEALFSYVLPHAGVIRLQVLDVQGRVVASPVGGAFASRSGMAHWSTSGFAPGLYFARLDGDGIAPMVTRLVVVH